MRLPITLAILVLVIQAANAQPMVEVEMIGQPLAYGKNGTVEGCGVRIVGIISPVSGQKTFRTFDVSANLWKSGLALGKMIGETNSVANPTPANSSRLPLKNGWMKALGKSPAAPDANGFRESNTDKLSYLFGTRGDAAFEFIVGAASAERVQVAVSWDSRAEWIYTGTVRLTPEERIQIAECLKEIT